MRKNLVAVAAVLALSALAPGGAPADGAVAADGVDDPGYALHEWGTFTTVAGSDGALLEGIHADDHALPDFVHRRDRIAPGHLLARGKMETPVLYLYSDREREVRVRVGFPKGLMTSWYPAVRAALPLAKEKAPALEGGVLDWGLVKVLAPGLGTEHLPEVAPDDPWDFAREPESNVLRICDLPTGSGTEWEKYLFYRGLGRFELPLRVEATEAAITLRCGDFDPGTVARAVRVEGGVLRTGVLRPGEGTEGALRTAALADLRPTTADDLAALLVDDLVARGLTRAEARGMVRTWRKSWLESPGTRILVPLARATVDEILPLQVSPAPREMVRVMVARLDILTPDEERRAEEVARTARDGAEAAAALGRWAVPVLRRVAATSKDPETARRAGLLARELEPLR
jgi:hypothetical protein